MCTTTTDGPVKTPLSKYTLSSSFSNSPTPSPSPGAQDGPTTSNSMESQ